MQTEVGLLLLVIVRVTDLAQKQRTFCIWFKLICGKFIIIALSTLVAIHLACNNSEYSCQKIESIFLHTGYCML